MPAHYGEQVFAELIGVRNPADGVSGRLVPFALIASLTVRADLSSPGEIC